MKRKQLLSMACLLAGTYFDRQAVQGMQITLLTEIEDTFASIANAIEKNLFAQNDSDQLDDNGNSSDGVVANETQDSIPDHAASKQKGKKQMSNQEKQAAQPAKAIKKGNNGCNKLRDISFDEVEGPPAFYYDENDSIYFDMQALSPDCEVRYECASVERVDGNKEYDTIKCDIDFQRHPDDENNLYFLANWEDYRKGRYAPGKYIVHMVGTAIENSQYSHRVSVEMELADICDPPKKLINKPDANMFIEVEWNSVYTIFIDDYFEIDPPVCQYEKLLGSEELPDQIPDSAIQTNPDPPTIDVTNRDVSSNPGAGEYKIYLMAESMSMYAEDRDNILKQQATLFVTLKGEPTSEGNSQIQLKPIHFK